MRDVRLLDLDGKRALIRVDFNVPLSDEGGILDDTRIRAALPTIRHVLEQGGSCVLMTHLGRPKGEPVDGLRLAPVARRLSDLLKGYHVRHCDEVVGERASEAAESLSSGEILLIENLRFHPGEKANDSEFAAELARLGSLYVNDAFAACHRRHASVDAVPRRFPPEVRAAGLLVAKEIEALDRVIKDPAPPLIAVFGGAKVSDKLATVRALIGRADRILIGGAMSYTLMKANGQEVGDSLVEEDHLEAAREILQQAGDRLWLPVDHAVARAERPRAERVFARDGIAEGFAGLDIGPETVARYQQEIRRGETVVWNGPMGKIELDPYLEGTRSIAEAVAESEGTTVVGGGETGEVLRRLGLADRVTHLSTGGGAFLEYMAHGTLPALTVLEGD